MSQQQVPKIDGLTLQNIGTYLHEDFGYKKYELGFFLDRTSKTFSRKATGESHIFTKDVNNLLKNMKKQLFTGTEEEREKQLYLTFRTWFPRLRDYDDQMILQIIVGNLTCCVYDEKECQHTLSPKYAPIQIQIKGSSKSTTIQAFVLSQDIPKLLD